MAALIEPVPLHAVPHPHARDGCTVSGMNLRRDGLLVQFVPCLSYLFLYGRTCTGYRFKRKMQTKPKNLSRGALAQRSGVNAETIRYYEKVSLLPEPVRSEGGHRVYEDSDLERLCFIRRCREMGFSLEEIRGLLSLVDGEHVSCERVKKIADEHLLDIRAKISDLRKMERTLRKLSANCSGDDVPNCPIIDALQAT
ncbi:MAG: MerR family mercuric resistance operon transcriptional regulator [Gammaproteobacteria bacterium]|jgi:MerR family mercuric resistance operon transcriptional regulator